jgi:hypothetical protein
MSRVYKLSGGPFDGEYREHGSDVLEVIAPRWPPPGVVTVSIPVAYGRYTHNGIDRCWPEPGHTPVPVMQWRGYTS